MGSKYTWEEITSVATSLEMSGLFRCSFAYQFTHVWVFINPQQGTSSWNRCKEKKQSIHSGPCVWEALNVMKTQLEWTFYMQVCLLSLIIPPKYAIFWKKKNGSFTKHILKNVRKCFAQCSSYERKCISHSKGNSLQSQMLQIWISELRPC